MKTTYLKKKLRELGLVTVVCTVVSVGIIKYLDFILNFFNTYSTAIQGFSTFALVLITALYAWQTRRTVSLMKEQDEQRNRPRVSVFLKQREEWLNLVDIVIANYGNESARNVSFSTSDDMILIGENNKLSNISIIRHGLKEIPPGHEMKVAHFSIIGRTEELSQKNIEIDAEYESASKTKNYNENFSLDFQGLIDRQLGQPPIHEISDNISKIQKSIERIENYFKKREYKEELLSVKTKDGN